MNFIYTIYNYLATLEEQNSRVKDFVALKFLIKIIKRILVIISIFLLRIKAKLGYIALINPDSNFVVSLTSFPGRISTVWFTIISLGDQKLKPSNIILYLSEEEFPGKYNDLPPTLIRLLEKGLEIRFVSDNLKAHKKYFYVMQEYISEIVITIDDDLLYPSDTFERLYKVYLEFPDCVIANRATRIEFSSQKVMPYSSWSPIYMNSKSSFLVAIGCGGVLYPPFFRCKELFNFALIKELSPLADDLWLKAIQLVNRVEVAKGPFYPHPMVIPRTNRTSLLSVNVKGEKLNDVQFDNLRNYFSLDKFLH